MSKFTEGPWHRRVGRIGDGTSASQHEQICNEEGRAVVMIEHDASREASANVHLIAAAPEMYAAIGELLLNYTRLIDSGDCGFWESETLPEVAQSRALLARIDGEGS